MIPKIIFQTHEHRYEDLPEHFKKTSLSWQNLNPGWAYVYHDKEQREEFILKYKPELHRIYKKVIKPHQADLWRYLIVYLEGGVYADMDSFCTTPMDYILKDLPPHIDLVSTKTYETGGVNNANFAAVKGSKILSNCINEIITYNSNKINMTVIHSSFSENVARNGDISLDIMRASHGRSYKHAFNAEDEVIDYYGEKMSYLEYLSRPIVV